MGNSLLDFVMALVRDPDAAARYASDPAGVLADAQLPGVTMADVNNLIPVVTDSLATATPGFGTPVDNVNVWTSGAAAAAFDAFDIHIPPADLAQHPAPPAVSVQTPEAPYEHYADGIPADLPTGEAPATIVDPTADQPVDPVTQDWAPQPDHHPGDPSGFDLF